MLQQTLEKINAPCTPGESDRVPDRGSFADPDVLLVEALKARNAAAFDDLAKQFGRRLLNVAMNITKNREDAEDVVQESFLKVFKNIDRFRAHSKFATWLTRIAINQALMLIRANTQNFVSVDESMEGDWAQKPGIKAGGYTPEQLCTQHEFEDVLLNLTNVRKSSRRVMELRVKHDLSEIEIAQVLNLTLSAVKARLYRGRLDLREGINRRFRSTKLAQACKKMFPTTTRRTNASVDLLSKVPFGSLQRGPKNEGLNSTSVSRLPSDNPLTTRYSQSSCDMESCLPDHFDPQQLTRPFTLQIGGPEIAL
jgi:RNA polymerase sigma-70 factor (ECF subfamily)